MLQLLWTNEKKIQNHLKNIVLSTWIVIVSRDQFLLQYDDDDDDDEC